MESARGRTPLRGGLGHGPKAWRDRFERDTRKLIFSLRQAQLDASHHPEIIYPPVEYHMAFHEAFVILGKQEWTEKEASEAVDLISNCVSGILFQPETPEFLAFLSPVIETREKDESIQIMAQMMMCRMASLTEFNISISNIARQSIEAMLGQLVLVKK